MSGRTASAEQRLAFSRLWRARVRRYLRRMPRRANLGRYPVLRHFRHWLAQFPYLWKYSAPHWIRAVYLGSIVTFLPIIGLQLAIGAALALVFRANLPLVALLQFVSNPLTGPVMYVASWKVGGSIVGALWPAPMGWGSAAMWNLGVGGVLCGLVMGAAIHLGVVTYRYFYRHLWTRSRK